MRRRIPITRTFAELVENRLQIRATGDDDSDVYDPQVEEQPEIIEISVEEGILVVPFDFEGDPVLVAIDQFSI
jgi:hypothetical protein